MKLDCTMSHRFGEEAIASKGMLDEISDLLNEPQVEIVRGASAEINRQIRDNLSRTGWALDPRVHPGFNVTVNALKNRVGLTVQTGNVARAFYDLMKFQAMFLNDKIDASALILPSNAAASFLGDNLPNFGRVSNELGLFRHIISVPCLLLAFGGSEDE